MKIAMRRRPETGDLNPHGRSGPYPLPPSTPSASPASRRRPSRRLSVVNHGDERGVSKADLDATIAGLETRLRADLAAKADLRDAVAGLATRASCPPSATPSPA